MTESESEKEIARKEEAVKRRMQIEFGQMRFKKKLRFHSHHVRFVVPVAEYYQISANFNPEKGNIRQIVRFIGA